MQNRDKIILDLCGGTGAWSRPYKDAGYDVRLITLPDSDVRIYQPPDHVYGILAAPPCTEFSLAKGGQQRDFASGVEVMAACLRIIWQCRCREKLAFWALENPVGFMRQFLGRPHYTFEQWQFGDLGIKPTDIWGYFKEPVPLVRERPGLLSIMYKDGHRHGRGMANPTCPPEYAGMGLDRAALRAITPPGWAKAFYQANPLY
ncbi:hypothetical protein [Hungatella effluvii]|uniref:hypothetical protein n=2 Tax=Lachnospiraceae TaxID=186803 RepID=UPI002A8023E8|nr:hypothetical protein [Hungatella effluvii]